MLRKDLVYTRYVVSC